MNRDPGQVDQGNNSMSMRIWKSRRTWACVALWGAGAAQATDLLTAYRLATEHDPVYAEARARYDAASQRVPLARSGLLPRVTLNGNLTRNDEDVQRPSPSRDSDWQFNSNGYTVALTQPLFRWQNWVGHDQAKLVVDQAQAALAAARQDLILRTAQAYFDVLYAQRNLKAARTYQEAISAQYKTAQQAFEIGAGIQTDIFDAEARMQLAMAQVIAGESELEVKRQALRVLIGSDPGELARGRSDAKLTTPQPADLSQWLTAAEEGNLTVQQSRIAAAVADKEVERQRAARYPTVDLVASAGQASTLNAGIRERTTAGRIGVQLSVPLYEGGEISAKTNEAVALRQAAMSAAESARRSAVLAAQQAYLGVVNGLAQMSALQSAEKAALAAVASNREARKVGVRLSIDVLNAETQAYNTHRDLLRVLLETLMSQLRLKAAVGTLGEDDVRAVNGLLAS